ncbi:TonB-dependent receptor [Methylocystis sp. MJC1]|uniref:TonB-dependent receptor n=1 Tax=Methylocystis sp. MJC1 TaxID=2654282 RepID=UPI0013ED2BF7|nr:TonB-dependent receptor [Methylocystis sp. MJC1]KAF2989057.1 Vitamin B12 transporter BtuB [Methylocystis sp. MJC1]MBU6527884.1 TonB-dependent receptor [Methylocystis sp. MJC1]UZX10807.1 TonB-dependent receptor [Methylocystis sp. MJC1]
MNRHSLLGAVSIHALLFFVSADALAQQSLPTIDVGARRGPARPSVSSAPRGPLRPPAPAAGPVVAPSAGLDRYAGPKPAPFSRTIPQNVPAVVESRTRQEIEKTVNVMTSAEAFKYLPSLLIRERYIGDRNAIVSGRTTGTIESAKTLVYADNVLLSNLLGNSFNFPPRWGMVSPAEIDRVDVIYGPFSALYPGNSIGGVLAITTRMPDKFELHASATGALQPFSLYGRSELDGSGNANLLIGDRFGDFRYFFSYDHLTSQGQAQTFPGNFMTPFAPRNGTRFYGGYQDFNQNGVPRIITGAAGADFQQQDMAKLKMSYDIAPLLRATYTLGVWNLEDKTSVQSFIYDRNGVPIYNTQSGFIAIGPFAVQPGGVNPGWGGSTHLMQALSLKRDTGGVFDFDLSATSYNFLRDYSQNATSYGLRPNGAATAYNINTTGQNTVNTGTYWRTGDARFIWRPVQDYLGKHEVSFGGHADVYSLNTVTSLTPFAGNNYAMGLTGVNYGKTETKAVYIQDAWKFLPDWKLIAGGRGEFWHAYNGSNVAGGLATGNGSAPGLVPVVPARATAGQFPDAYKNSFSPKAALEYQVTPEFAMRGSMGRAYRFPTVNELFQSLTTSSSVIVNNPNLQPEISTSWDLTGEYRKVDAFNGAVGLFNPRVSLFLDDRWNAIVSQSAIGPTGQIVTQNANLDKARFRGIEGAIVMKDILTPGLDYSGSVTFVDSKILSNGGALALTGSPAGSPFPTAGGILLNGMQYPRVPRIRIRSVVSYSPTKDWSVSFGARYASAAFVTLNNVDFNHNNYGSVDSEYLVFDAKLNYKLAPEWTLTAGIDNIGRWKYYVNPNPYNQRTFFLGLKYDIGGLDGGATVAGLNGGVGAAAPGAR